MRQRGGLVTSAIESLLRSGTLVGLSEQELLDRFVREGDRRALEAIVARHGPLVHAVCRQILADANDVEDAFQATFLVLIRRASSVRRPGSLASWLHGVAYRIALRIKRGNRPGQLPDDAPGRDAPCPVEEREALAVLHQEIDRLPPKYRLPIVLCYLEGMTHDGAATHLHWPVGTVRGRLARARDRLRERLTRREITLAAGFMETAWLDQAPLSENQIQAILDLLGNNASSRISNLVQGALTAMLIEKMKSLAFTFTTACLVVLAACSGLVASARTGPENAGAGPIVQVKTEDRHVTVSTEPVPLPKPESPHPQRAENSTSDRDLEARADSLEEHRVMAELLEMETALLKKDVERLISDINRYESRVAQGNDAEGSVEANVRYLDFVRSKLKERQVVYSKKRLELARLVRQIERESRAPYQRVGEKADLAEISRRLGELETKVEMILQLLSKERR